jgi:rhamnosyltransferase subunit B
MARIVLTCWGSHGDVDPYLGLGAGLRARGHRVTVATIDYYRPYVEGAGLEFRPVRPRVEPTDTAVIERIMDARHGTEYLLRNLLFPAIHSMYEDIDAAAEDADILVSHPITFATPMVAERRRLPWASTVLAPASMFSTYDFPAVPPAPWLKSLQRLGRWPGTLIVGAVRRMTASWVEPMYRFRDRLGLERGAHPIFEGQHSPHLVLALYSRVLGERQPDWPPNVVVTGHMFYDASHGASLSPGLESFLQSGPPPVVFTLGSSVVVIAKEFWAESIAAVRHVGARAVLLAGDRAIELSNRLRAESAAEPATIIAVERAPHSLLFSRASVVVQQCGIGTLAQSLRSGRPMLAVPYSHDQPDNAWGARRLGMARIINPGKYRASRVASALRSLTREPHYAAAAARVASAVRAERGVEAACDAIEQTFGTGLRKRL